MNLSLRTKLFQLAAQNGIGIDFEAEEQRKAYPGIRPWARFFSLEDGYSILTFETFDDIGGYSDKLIEDGLGFSVVSLGHNHSQKDEEAFRSMVADWGLLKP